MVDLRAKIAEHTGSVISAVLFGALAGTGVERVGSGRAFGHSVCHHRAW